MFPFDLKCMHAHRHINRHVHLPSLAVPARSHLVRLERRSCLSVLQPALDALAPLGSTYHGVLSYPDSSDMNHLGAQ